MFRVRVFDGCFPDIDIPDVVEYRQEDGFLIHRKKNGGVIYINLNKAKYVIISKEV